MLMMMMMMMMVVVVVVMTMMMMMMMMLDRQPVYAEQVEPVDTQAEVLLQYISTFNDLMTAAKYKQAATHAANSPNGVLRTAATFDRFKG